MGRVARASNADVCFPAGSDCSGIGEARRAAFQSPQRCAEGRPFEATHFKLPALPDGFVDPLLAAGKAAPDGTLWFEVVGYPPVLPTVEIAMHVFLYQVDQEGNQLGVIEIPVNTDSQESTLVIDEEGTVSVAGGTQHFRSYGSNAKPLDMSEQVQWLRLQRVAADSPSGYVIAGESTSSRNTLILSRFRKDGTLLRSNNQIPALFDPILPGPHPLGLVGVTSHAQAGYSLLLTQPNTDAYYRVVRLNSELSNEWFMPLPPEVSSIEPAMVNDSQGRLVIVANIDRPHEQTAAFYGVDVDGTSLFAFDFAAPMRRGLPLTAELNASKVWGVVGVPGPYKDAAFPTYVVELDATASTCLAHPFPELNIETGGSLMITPEGSVFMLANESLMRLREAPEE